MLMAKSRHKKPENVRHYFKPSLAVAGLLTRPGRPLRALGLLLRASHPAVASDACRSGDGP
jgi:hypothetical protein